ncbi:Structural maintenance of chromosomes protein 2 [Gurleya vavrai]
MQITDIKIKGFKSFSQTVFLQNLTPFTSITGLNGLGKSNILDAIIFCLHLETNKILRIKKLTDLINAQCSEALVQIKFKSKDKSLIIERSIMKDGKTKSSINNHPCTLQSLKKMLNENGILKGAQNIVLQGNITKVLEANKNFKFFVQETAGIISYEEEKRNALDVLESKEHKLCLAKESLTRRIGPFVTRMREERHNYVEQRRCEESRDENSKKVDALEKMLEENNRNKTLKEINSFVQEYTKAKKELEEEKLKVVDEIVCDNLDFTKRYDNKKREIILIENQIKLLKESIEEEDDEKENCKKRRKENFDYGSIRRKIMFLKEKELFMVQELKREEKKDVGISAKYTIKEKTQELEKNKKRKMELEDLLNKSRLYEKPKRGRKPSLGENNERRAILQCLISKKESYENLKIDEKELNNLKDQLSRKKIQLNYPIKDGVLGTIYENLEIKSEKYKEAIDVILGGRRNYVVVENENIGEEVIKYCKNKRVNVIPLNKIKSNFDANKNKNIKSQNGICASDLITYNPKIKTAVDIIFGSFYVFENKENAKNVCYKNNVTCVTLDGNIYDPRGVITGGNRKTFNSVIIRKKDIEDLENKINLMDIKNKEFTKIADEYYKMHNDIERITMEEKYANEYVILENKIKLIEEVLSNNKNDFEDDLKNVKKEIYKLEEVLKSKTKEDDEAKIQEEKNISINNEINILLERKIIYESEVCLMSKELKEFENKQNEMKEYEKTKKITEEKIRNLVSFLSKIKSKLKKLADNIKIEEERMNPDNDIKFNSLPVELKDMLGNLKNYLFVEAKIMNDIEEDKFRNLLYNCKKDLESISKNVKLKMDPKNFEMLEKNEEMIKQLEERIEKLENDKEKLKNNINELTKESEEELKKAFEHLNKEVGNFLRTFISESDVKINENFEIRVKIGNWKESLSELSGGQRSIVALCFIFAMLTYKPASFYLFDEIDSALDLSFTQSIGENIRKKFNDAQFIVVSLKEGLFENAESIFQVFLNEGRSDIRKIK